MNVSEIVPEAVIAEARRIIDVEYRFSVEQFTLLMKDHGKELPLQELREAYRNTLMEVGFRFYKEDPTNPDAFDLGQYVSRSGKNSMDSAIVSELRADHREKLIAFYQKQDKSPEEAAMEADEALACAEKNRDVGGTYIMIDADPGYDPSAEETEEEPVSPSGQYPEGDIYGVTQCIPFIPPARMKVNHRGAYLSRLDGQYSYQLLWQSIRWALGAGYATLWVEVGVDDPEQVESLKECGFERVLRKRNGRLLLRRPLSEIEYVLWQSGDFWDE